MKPEIRAQWVERLRSGQDQQGTGYLRKRDEAGVDRLCCLGVLCELAVEAGVEMEVNRTTDGGHYDATSYDKSIAFPPRAVREWAGIMDSSIGEIGTWAVDKGDYREALSNLNDEGYTFAQIADEIENDKDAGS
jgi:hypothetical protein